MEGKWFPEDINGIVSIDNKIAERSELKRANTNNSNR